MRNWTTFFKKVDVKYKIFRKITPVTYAALINKKLVSHRIYCFNKFIMHYVEKAYVNTDLSCLLQSLCEV